MKRDYESNYRTFLNNTRDVIWSLSFPDLNILYLSTQVETLYGQTPDEFINNPKLWQELTHPDDRYLNDLAFEQLQKEGVSKRECRIIRKDGTIRWIYDKSTMIYDADNNPIRIEGVVSDITELKQAEETIRIKDKVIESSSTAIAFADMTGVLTYVNPLFLCCWGYQNVNEVLGKQVTEFWENPNDAAQVVDALKNQGFWKGEMKARRWDSSLFDVEVIAHLIADNVSSSVLSTIN